METVQIDKRIYDLKEYQIHEFYSLLNFIVMRLEDEENKSPVIQGLINHIKNRKRGITEMMERKLKEIRENK